MSECNKILRGLRVGDLVTHALYGDRWVGLIIDFEEVFDSKSKNRKIKALIQIQPGTDFEGFFKRTSPKDRINDNRGFVSVHWLFKIKERK
tara:strand:- start:921 stop:1193 length:273 start_codon:yes stop_codon:yes gene_type:complete